MRYGLTQLLLNTDGVAPVSGDQHYHYGDRADDDHADGDHHYVDDDADKGRSGRFSWFL